MTTKQKNEIVNNYILDAISREGYDKVISTDTEKLQFLADNFKSEYSFPDSIKRYGSYQETFRQWLMGLPSSFNIDFENYRIIEIAKEWGDLPAKANDKQEDKIIDNWFNYIAAKTIILMGKNGVKITD